MIGYFFDPCLKHFINHNEHIPRDFLDLPLEMKDFYSSLLATSNKKGKKK